MKETKSRRPRIIAAAMILSLATGCSDERVTQVATRAADRQSEQNDTMAKLQQAVASGTRTLVEADADARHEILAVHHDLQAERSQLDASWSKLEDERKTLASERRTESMLLPVAELLGGLVLVVTLLGFCWYALVRLRVDTTTEAELNELLAHELTVSDPLRLVSQESPAQIAHKGDRLSDRV
jgi:cell division protein FtsL